MLKLREFVKENTDLFALVLGMLIFYEFSNAQNEGIISFLWLFSSFMVIAILNYISVEAFIKGSLGTKLIIGAPISLIDLVLALQFIQDLQADKNIYSLNLINSLISAEGILHIMISIMIVSIVALVFMIVKIKNQL